MARAWTRAVWLVAVLVVLFTGCGGSTTEVEDETTEAETTTTPTPAPTTTQPPTTTTTTETAFNLDDLDEFMYNSTNHTCAWATDHPPLSTGQRFDSIDEERLALSLQVGEEIDPFLEAVADMDLTAANPEEIKTALAEACREIGAPTDEYFAQFSG